MKVIDIPLYKVTLAWLLSLLLNCILGQKNALTQETELLESLLQEVEHQVISLHVLYHIQFINWFQLVSANFSQFQPISANFSQFQPISTNFNQLQPTSTNFNQFQPISTNFNQFQPITTSWIEFSYVYMFYWILKWSSKNSHDTWLIT